MAGALPPDRIPELVQFICALASERDEALTQVRLVKFLYLADLYFARRHGGQTLTGWPWCFVHFGPYCRESLEAVDMAARRGLIAQQAYVSRYSDEERSLYRAQRGMSVQAFERSLDDLCLEVGSRLKRAVRKWADDTPGLLTHVYFETEPMEGVRPSDYLDFRKARALPAVQKVPAVKLSSDKLKKAREALASLSGRTTAPQRTALDSGAHDEAFMAFARNDADEDAAPAFGGVVDFGDLSQPDVEH